MSGVRDGGIVNKMKGEPGQAWGVLMWKKRLRDYWLEYDADVLSYTHAFNMALNVFSHKTFELSEYTDISNFADYARLING